MNSTSLFYLCILWIGLTTTSCIKQQNLYDPDDKTQDKEKAREVISETDFLYPFINETPEKQIEITIRLQPGKPQADLTASMPALKYNKKWLFMLTQDDCKPAAFSCTWAAINGKPISDRYYYDLAQLREGDLPPDAYFLGKTLGSTDGAGREVRFSFATTLAPEWDYMNATTNVFKGFTENYYRFFLKSGLVWGNVREMLNYGVGIAFHDMKMDNSTSQDLVPHFEKSQEIILNKLSGRGCKMLAEPGGDKAYLEAAKSYPLISTLTAQTGALIVYPFKEGLDIDHVTIERAFYDRPAQVEERITQTLASNTYMKRPAIYIGVHNTGIGWVDLLKWINDSYGKDGDDSVWFPNQEEYYEYTYYRNRSLIKLEQQDATTWKLTLTLTAGSYFYYPSVTVNVAGLQLEDIASVESNETVTGLSYANYSEGLMLNIDCRKYLAEHAEHFVERYEKNRSDASAKADATYFVSMLKESAQKDALNKRIK